jgi:hypothetical protein
VRRILAAVVVAIGLTNCATDPGGDGPSDADLGDTLDLGNPADGPCPTQMALVAVADIGPVCVDRFEAATVEPPSTRSPMV